MLWSGYIQTVLYTSIATALASTDRHTKKHTSSIEVTLIPGDELFVVPVRVGQSTLNLSIDTGSSDLWTFSSNLPRIQQTHHNLYKPSRHAQRLKGYNFTASYAEGTTVHGTVYKDTVQLGNLSATRASVQAASDVPRSFVTQTSRDGILGFGFGNINTVWPTPQPTFFESIKDQLAAPLFATSLRKYELGNGRLDLGFIDHAKYEEDKLSYVRVNQSQGFWAVSLEGYTVGNLSSKAFDIETVAIDTGTSVLMLPEKMVHDYYAEIPSASNDPDMNGFIFSCDDDVPDLALDLGKYTATIPGDLMTYAELGDYYGDTMCFGSLQSQGELGFSVLGHPFLKSHYVVFDMGEIPRVGIGKQVL